MPRVITNVYYFVAKSSRVNDIITLFIEAFPNHTKDITRPSFGSSLIHCRIYVVDGDSAQLIMTSSKPAQGFSPDIQLETYTDISSIPLMDVGLTGSKLNNG